MEAQQCSRRWGRVCPRALFTFFTILLATDGRAATFTVTNTNDSGAGSLRQAIDDANGSAGFDTIAFAIPGAGVHTIIPQTLLPTITDPVLIDGYTQPGSSENTDPTAMNAVLLIELDGTAIQGANRTGLTISSSEPSTIQGLVVNRCSRGIRAAGTGSHTIRGNFVGTDPTGTIPLENHDGVSIGGSGTTLVGGLAPGDRNLLSGNSDGIETTNASAVIQGNLVGTDPTGTLAIPNLWGIHVATLGGAGVLIGGTAPGAGNVVSGNTSRGIQLTQNPNNAVVQGNRIGTTADGSGPLGNGEGIVYELAGAQTTIGGIGPGEANVIAYNALRGVVVTGGGGSGNTIRGNSIHDNGVLGIDLRNDFAPNFNDSQDADNGPNGLQNFPLIQEVEHLGPQGAGSTRIAGRLNSAPSATFDLDFYSNTACPNFPREFIEGEIYLGSTQVTTDGNGDASFDVTLPVQTEAGARISATATDPNGNTSEFSQRIVFSMTPASGSANGGALLAINGTDFADPTTVLIGGAAPSNLVLLDDHRLTANAPALPPGTSSDVVVTIPEGTTGTLIKGWVTDFLDVPPANIFHDFVVTLISNGITAGVGGGLYGVDQGTKRQQMAVFLLKAKNGLCYVPPPCTGTFPDVPCPSTFADWIEDLAAQGITTGCGGALFCPNNLVTRRQMAVFLLKTKYGSSYVPPACTGVFDDVPCPAAPAVDFIERLAAEQITGGCSVTPPLYCPDNSSTRGQMAVFITKTFNLQ